MAVGDNASRARRGLLPRKEKRAPARSRLVYHPPAPVWLDEPGTAEEPAVAASAPGLAVPEEIADDAVHAWLETPRVEIILVRRRAGEEGPLVEATVEGALVDALLVRRGGP